MLCSSKMIKQKQLLWSLAQTEANNYLQNGEWRDLIQNKKEEISLTYKDLQLVDWS